ncbi:MAG: Rossmann-like domain-containing protein [Chloroflexota bacterium]
MTTVNENLLQSLLPGEILAVQVGLSRTAILAETDDGIRCGLAATLSNPDFDHHHRPSVRNAGHLHEVNYIDLAGLIESPSFTEVSIGLATINALLPREPAQWVDLNAEDYLAQWGVNKNIVVVGHFPFIKRLKPLAKKLWVLELSPKDDDLPAYMAPEIIPQADLVAITATTLINKTFQSLIDLCRTDARVILIGPSTPLSPALYHHGINVLSGAIVTNPEKALRGIGQGISLQQLRQEGIVRLVTMKKDQANGK